MRFFALAICFLFVVESQVYASLIVPPGTVSLDKKTQTYIDVSEVTVLDWVEYLYWIKNNKGENSDEYKAAMPDSATCEKLYGAVRYFQHPKYRHYPIVGLTHEQALNYCLWRSDRVNELNKNKAKKYTIIYLLPDSYDFQKAYKKQRKNKNIDKTIHPINPKNKRIVNIGYNVQEYTSNSDVILIGTDGERLIFDDFMGISYMLGFRCKAVVVKNK